MYYYFHFIDDKIERERERKRLRPLFHIAQFIKQRYLNLGNLIPVSCT